MKPFSCKDHVLFSWVAKTTESTDPVVIRNVAKYSIAPGCSFATYGAMQILTINVQAASGARSD